MKQKIKELSKEKMGDILCKVMDILSEEQYVKFENIVLESMTECSVKKESPVMVRMSQELVDEKRD